MTQVINQFELIVEKYWDILTNWEDLIDSPNITIEKHMKGEQAYPLKYICLNPYITIDIIEQYR